MKSIIRATGLPLILAVSSIMCSCVATETLEPLKEKGEQIVINLSVPENDATRASADHKLRYTAKLFYGSKGNVDENTMQKKELIEGTKEKNQIIFDVPEGETYTIVVFADYIPTENIGADGTNKDCYYNTSISNTNVEMLTTPGNAASMAVSPEFFNNDNYDCFFACVQVEKTKLKVVCDLELQRAVAKVRFLDSTSAAGNFNIAVTKLGYLKTLELMNDQSLRDPNYTSFKSFAEVDPGAKSFSDGSAEKEVLFYYTFADPQSSSPQYSYIKFTVTDNEAHSYVFDPGDGKIEIKRNFITTVRSNFLGTKSSGTGGDDNPSGPGNTTDPTDPTDPSGPGDSSGSGDDEYGPIYLNLSISSESWDSFDKNL